MSGSADELHRDVMRQIQAGRWQAAETACRRLTDQHPTFAAGWFAASRIALALKSPAAALHSIDRAIGIAPASAAYLVHRAHCLMALKRAREALGSATAAARYAPTNFAIWGEIGTIGSYAGDHRLALAAFDRAIALAPLEAQLFFNRASVRRFLGDLEGAEADYDRVISLKPLDYEAYLNRSALRTQTAARNHVAELERLTLHPIADWRAEVQIRYALAKEYEDLGKYRESFRQLRLAARMRRDHMDYAVSVDVATVGWIIGAFPNVPAHSAPCASSAVPIFIVGLPRSGSTLVERILSSHSLISSAGELDCFALATVDAVSSLTGQSRVARQELIAAAATLDYTALGQDYLRRVRSVFDGGHRFIDKMPLNYLYCGLIYRALPNARIVHVTRHPMAACYAMYKTLFDRGYPFSYDLDELAQYYIAYRVLMQHWHAVMPGVIHEVSYEALVADPTATTRELLSYCGLDWEDACATFHQNPAASTTASASQIRHPIHRSSVAQWRHYEHELSSLEEKLTAAGVCAR
jgi:tetratricopeptide (TPR) repeat protein